MIRIFNFRVHMGGGGEVLRYIENFLYIVSPTVWIPILPLSSYLIPTSYISFLFFCFVLPRYDPNYSDGYSTYPLS